MCNLYSMTTNQEAARRLFRVKYDRAGPVGDALIFLCRPRQASPNVFRLRSDPRAKERHGQGSAAGPA